MAQYHRRDWRPDATKPRRKRRRFVSKTTAKNLLLILIALGIAGTLFLLAVFALVSRDLPDPNTLTSRDISQTTKIYDRTGEHLLYEIFGDENRTLSKIQEGFCRDLPDMEFKPEGIPLVALQATIAAEDRNFCSHHGFSAKGILRAVIFRGNRGGGSTLTQQLVKNAILSNEKTITRKIKELILSIELERRYAKDEILQIYFNEIPYGSTYYGIQSAATNYFNKDVKDLTIAEAATLAALPQAPTTYTNNPDRLLERRNWILDGMSELGFISESERDQAKAEETPVQVNVHNITAPHFVFYVKEQLEALYGQRQVEEGGLRVITSLDYDKQLIAEEEVAKGVEEKGELNNFSNASLVAIDPKNGHILAMVGSKDFFDDEIDGKVNVSTRLRQPGSSFKPIVYAKAFELGYTPNTVLWDVKTNFPTATGTYSPNNYDLGERGPVRLRQALQGSLNIPAVKLLYLVGVERALDFAEDLGYTSFKDRSQFGLAIVLGGGEVKLLEHVNAYATFANEGVHYDPVSILRVEDDKGTVLEEWQERDGKEVLDKNVARMLSNVLSDNAARAYVFGLNSPLSLGGRPVAAKTGTTNDYHDGWTLGYTPSLAAGVWAGNNNNDPMRAGSGGSMAAAPIWNGFMRRALADTPVQAFPPPQIPVTGKAMLDGNLASVAVTIDRASGKLATEFTPPALREEKLFAEYHTILHYVSRSDPRGGAPSDPEQADGYYRPWEDGVQDWIRRQEEKTGIKIEQSAPPTEYDDIHTGDNTPQVRIISPASDAEFSDRAIEIAVDANASRGISRVEFYLDGFFLGSDNSFPYIISTTIPNTVSRGYHTLKAVAFDDVDNSGSDNKGIRITSDPTGSNFEIIDPKNGQTIERTGDPFTVVTSLQHPSEYSIIRLYAQSLDTGRRELVEVARDPGSEFITFRWNLPEAGRWVLTAEAQHRESGETLQGVGVIVQITEPPQAATPPSEETPTAEEIPLPPLNELNPFTPATP